MRVIIQRVIQASVEVEDNVAGKIKNGLLLLVGFEPSDTENDLDWMLEKILKLRIFNDAQGKMNVDICQSKGQLLVVSQFTLFASTKKGNRPSFVNAAKAEDAKRLYDLFVSKCGQSLETQTGIFGAHMQVKSINDGPVTITIDSKNINE